MTMDEALAKVADRVTFEAMTNDELVDCLEAIDQEPAPAMRGATRKQILVRLLGAVCMKAQEDRDRD